MRSNGYRWLLRFSCGALLLLAAFNPGRAQDVEIVVVDSVRAEALPSNSKPFRNDVISVAINVDMSALQAPNNRLAAYQATLKWNHNVVQFLGTTAAPAPWDTPNLNVNDVTTGKIEWNDFVAGGISGKINILNLNFRAIGNPGDSTILDLSFSEMTNSAFVSLLPVLVVKGGKVVVQNRPPDIAPIPPQTMNENATLNVTTSATDPENGKITFRAVNLPAFGAATITSNTVTILFSPDFSAAGVYRNIMVIASDDGKPIKSDTTTFALTVNNVNRPPKITPLPAQITLNEGVKTDMPLSATDPDGDKIALSGRNLPAFVSITDSGNGTGVLRFSPGSNDAGNYLNLKVFATDNGVPPLADSTKTHLTVNDSPPPPPVCKIGIDRPRGGTICGAEVEVCVSTTISGTIGKTTKTIIVNGIAVPVDCIRIPLVNGPNKIVARLTVRDSLYTCVSADSVTIIGRYSPLSCTLNLTAPGDSAAICAASVEVKGTATIAGGIIPLTSKLDINGVPATRTGNAFSVPVPLQPGWNTLIATFAVTDSCNNTVVCRDTVRVQSFNDTIAPRCTFVKIGGTVTGTFIDRESGIAKIEPLLLQNFRITVEPFKPGAQEVKFRLDAIDPNERMAFDIKIFDQCGNSHICDPVFLQLSAERAGNPYVFQFRSIDRYLELTNKGLTELRVELNGKRFSFSTARRGGSVQSLGVYAMPAHGEVMLDLQTYLRDSGDNDIRIEVVGPAGSSADLLLIDEIHDADGILALQEVPLAYELSQNYPNPFNPETVIRFGIPAHIAAGTPVQLRIYNMLGELVRTLVDQPMSPGNYTAHWSGRNERGIQVAAGVYIYRIVAGEYRATKRMLLLK